jgi:hypothetical protein
MPADRFFAYASEIMKLQPPHATDQPILARMKRIGFEPGKSFDLSKAPQAVQTALANAPADAKALMRSKLQGKAGVVDGWMTDVEGIGVYGNDYLKRATTAQQGLGANSPEDAVYPFNLADDTGKPLNGANRYALHFANGELPPAEAFWSITLYDSEGFPVANPRKRFALSSWMPLKRNADGSMDLFFQADNPGGEREANWLPAPAGPFNLLMRIYAPESAVLTRKWNPPPVERETTTR